MQSTLDLKLIKQIKTINCEQQKRKSWAQKLN